MRRISSIFFGLLILMSCSGFKPLEQRLLSPDESVRTKALKKIASLSPEKKSKLVAPLVQSLLDQDNKVVDRAALALVIIGTPAIEAVHQNLHHPDVFVRVTAISIFGQMGTEAQTMVPALTECLKDAHPLVRDEAAFALGQMGEAAESARPFLIEALKQANLASKETISDALRKISTKSPIIS